ncbi:MAG: hypothetical protein HC866_09740 [Leptolyngbyaceae cyanobacterium RU_5_1]|nr:hypothetical protein [Leptolyngbyaceae cyanobacterium RU_5_1]
MYTPSSLRKPEIAKSAAPSLNSLDVKPTRTFTVSTKRATFGATVCRFTTATETFETSIANATTITFASGIISTGEGGTINNEVSGGRYFGMVDTASGVSSAFGRICWRFPIPILALGADWIGTSDSNGLTLSGNFDGNETRTVSFNEVLGFPGNGFLGIVGTTPFSEIIFQGEGLRFGAEGFRVGNLLIAFAPFGQYDRRTNIVQFPRR